MQFFTFRGSVLSVMDVWEVTFPLRFIWSCGLIYRYCAMTDIKISGTLKLGKNSKRDRVYPMVCEYCGDSFTTTRRDQKTCSPTCRKNLSIRRRTEKEVKEAVDHAIVNNFDLAVSKPLYSGDLLDKALNFFKGMEQKYKFDARIHSIKYHDYPNGPSGEPGRLVKIETCVLLDFGPTGEPNRSNLNRFCREHEYLYPEKRTDVEFMYDIRQSMEGQHWTAFPYYMLQKFENKGLFN